MGGAGGAAGEPGKEVKKELVKKPPIETASWCYRDKEDDVHHDFAWTITNFSRKINMVPNGEYIESDKFSVTAHGMDLEWQLCLYPSGKDCEDEEHVSILLELVSRSVITNNCIGSFIYCCSSIAFIMYVILIRFYPII